MRCKGYTCCFFSVAGLLRSKLRQAGYGEETAFVPQACITARKTLKTGWRNPYVLQKKYELSNLRTYKLTNFQTYKLSNLQTTSRHKTTKAGTEGRISASLGCFVAFLWAGIYSCSLRSSTLLPSVGARIDLKSLKPFSTRMLYHCRSFLMSLSCTRSWSKLGSTSAK